MASTITAATLTVTHTESISLNGSSQGASNSFSIASINEVSKRIVRCPANVDTTIFRSGVSADVTDNSLDNETATILLAAGQSLVMGTAHDSIAAYDADASVQTTLHDLESILIDPSANAVDVEIFVASASA